jgi:hypothetical protein
VLEYDDGPEGDSGDKAEGKKAVDNIFRNDMGLAVFHTLHIIPYGGEAPFSFTPKMHLHKNCGDV